LQLPAGYGPDDVAEDVELCGRIPDLSPAAPRLGDMLVAVEFLRATWPALVSQGRGRFLGVNLRATPASPSPPHRTGALTAG
jgi:hypothetical protein